MTTIIPRNHTCLRVTSEEKVGLASHEYGQIAERRREANKDAYLIGNARDFLSYAQLAYGRTDDSIGILKNKGHLLSDLMTGRIDEIVRNLDMQFEPVRALVHSEFGYEEGAQKKGNYRLRFALDLCSYAEKKPEEFLAHMKNRESIDTIV